jgi:hypothetical protein
VELITNAKRLISNANKAVNDLKARIKKTHIAILLIVTILSFILWLLHTPHREAENAEISLTTSAVKFKSQKSEDIAQYLPATTISLEGVELIDTDRKSLIFKKATLKKLTILSGSNIILKWDTNGVVVTVLGRANDRESSAVSGFIIENGTDFKFKSINGKTTEIILKNIKKEIKIATLIPVVTIDFYEVKDKIPYKWPINGKINVEDCKNMLINKNDLLKVEFSKNTGKIEDIKITTSGIEFILIGRVEGLSKNNLDCMASYPIYKIVWDLFSNPSFSGLMSLIQVITAIGIIELFRFLFKRNT